MKDKKKMTEEEEEEQCSKICGRRKDLPVRHIQTHTDTHTDVLIDDGSVVSCDCVFICCLLLATNEKENEDVDADEGVAWGRR